MITLIYNKKNLNIKKKSDSDEATGFCNEKMPEVGSTYICVFVMLNNFVLKKDKNNFPQVLLEECKYIGKEQ